MKVIDLIEILQSMPSDREVLHVWDGKARTAIQHVWLANDGNVITADDNMTVYSQESFPIGIFTNTYTTPESEW